MLSRLTDKAADFRRPSPLLVFFIACTASCTRRLAWRPWCPWSAQFDKHFHYGACTRRSACFSPRAGLAPLLHSCQMRDAKYQAHEESERSQQTRNR